MCFWSAKTQDVLWAKHRNATWSDPGSFPILGMLTWSKGKQRRIDDSSHWWLDLEKNSSVSQRISVTTLLLSTASHSVSYKFHPFLMLPIPSGIMSDFCWTELKKCINANEQHYGKSKSLYSTLSSLFWSIFINEPTFIKNFGIPARALEMSHQKFTFVFLSLN